MTDNSRKSGGKTRHNPYRSNLAKFLPTKIDSEDIKRRGWQEEGILVVHEHEQRLAWPERQVVQQIATKLYGKRKRQE